MTPHPTEAALHDFADGALPPAQAAGVRRHLAECGECRARVERIRALAERLAGLPRLGEPPRDLFPDIAARVHRGALDDDVPLDDLPPLLDDADEHEGDSGRGADDGVRVTPLRPRRAEPVSSGAWLLRAAAAALLFVGGVAVGRGTGPAEKPQAVAGADTPTVVVPKIVDSNDATLAAREIQRTGSEYVAAVAAFTSLTDNASADEVAQAREVALSAIYGASKELARVSRSDTAAAAIFRTVANELGPAPPTRDTAAADSTGGVRF